MTGTAPNYFSPEIPMTRAMMMTTLARLAGVNTEGGATWYEKGMAWAMATGVSDGTNPLANITREQLVTMLYRYAKSPAASYPLNFPDAGNTSTWARTAMEWAVSLGIIQGHANGTLDPQGLATRAQLAAILQRFTMLGF